MGVLKALVIAIISFNSQLFGQRFIEDKKDRNLLDGNKKALGQGTKFSDLPFTTETVYANFSTVYVRNVSLEQQCLFIYSYSETNKTTAIRVSASSSEAQDTFPITFVVRQQQGILSWQVPLYVDFVYEFQSMDRTLCPMNKTRKQNITSHQNIFLEVATMSNTILNFNLTATILPDFEFERGVTKHVTASPTKPQYYMYTFPEDVEVVLLNVASDNELCAVISVQQIKCPVLDLDEDIGNLGKHYTMTTQAAMSLWKSDYNGNDAFYVVVLVKPNVADCSVLDLHSPAKLSVATKNLSISITERSRDVSAIIIPIVAFFTFDLVFGIIFCIFCMSFKCRNSSNIPTESTGAYRFMVKSIKFVVYYATQIVKDTNDLVPRVKISIWTCTRMILFGQKQAISDKSINQLMGSQVTNYQTMRTSQSDSGQPSSSPGVDPQASTSIRRNIEDIDGEADSSDVAYLHVAQPDADVTRNQDITDTGEAPLDMLVNKMKNKRSYESAIVYLWILGTIILFYGLPAVQLVLTYPKKMTETGDEDLCYYNFECAYPIRMGGYKIRSFNSIISNIGYVFLGVLFLVLVFLRNCQHVRHVLANPTCENCNGIPRPYGLLYAMGCALIVEGVMSACYHICPTYSNYQFDTSFMYVITCLCILKIYECRHPDVHPKAHTSYFCMGVYTCIGVLGIISDESACVWIFYLILHVLCAAWVGYKVYTNGIIKDECVRTGDQHQKFCICFCLTEKRIFMIWLVLMGIFNVTLAFVGVIVRKPDFATYLLIILLVNLSCYLLLHIVMKCCCDGSIDICICSCRRTDICTCIRRLFNKCTFFILAAIIMWGVAISYYCTRLSSWELSPEESRKHNKPCLPLDFYDYHDIWHFLSAGGIFFSFMVLLTLDDDLDNKPQSTIFIF